MAEIIQELEQIVGPGDVLTGDARLTRTSAWETHQPCNALAIVRPSSTDEVAAIMRHCHEIGQTVVPYGGLTNLVQGCVTTNSDIALSFEKMNLIEEVDRTGLTMVAGAGVTLQQAQERAAQEDLFFPVDIGARATCMVVSVGSSSPMTIRCTQSTPSPTRLIMSVGETACASGM